MKDEHLKSFCDNPQDYDLLIAWIAIHNPAAKFMGGGSVTPEDWAANAVNDCIRGVIFGDAGAYYATGMAMAVRVRKPQSKDLKTELAPLGTVKLVIDPCGFHNLLPNIE